VTRVHTNRVESATSVTHWDLLISSTFQLRKTEQCLKFGNSAIR